MSWLVWITAVVFVFPSLPFFCWSPCSSVAAAVSQGVHRVWAQQTGHADGHPAGQRQHIGLYPQQPLQWEPGQGRWEEPALKKFVFLFESDRVPLSCHQECLQPSLSSSSSRGSTRRTSTPWLPACAKWAWTTGWWWEQHHSQQSF